MYSIFIETCLSDFLLIIMKNKKAKYIDYKKDLVEKSDYLSESFSKGLQKLKIKTNDIEEIYITNGPGSFMGSRASVIFAKTIAYLNNARLFVGSTLEWISHDKATGIFSIDAKSNQSFVLDKNKKENYKIELKEHVQSSIIDYAKFIKKINKSLLVFKEVPTEEVLFLEPNYIKEPKIG